MLRVGLRVGRLLRLVVLRLLHLRLAVGSNLHLPPLHHLLLRLHLPLVRIRVRVRVRLRLRVRIRVRVRVRVGVGVRVSYP